MIRLIGRACGICLLLVAAFAAAGVVGHYMGGWIFDLEVWLGWHG